MNLLDIDSEIFKDPIIDAFTFVYGEKYRDIVRKQINNTCFIYYFDVDGIYSYCGGDNLADEYIHAVERFGFWRDNAVLLEGEATKSFIAMFIEMWYTSTKESLKIYDYLVESNISNEESFVLPFADGPNMDTHTAYEAFKSLINEATVR